jgi:chromosome segregation ATPase
MKITLTAKHREEITDLRSQLVAVLEGATNSTAEVTRLTNSQEKLQKEIATLEDSDSESAASALATKRVQLEGVTKKISKLENVPAKISVEAEQAGVNLLKQFARTATAATASDVEKYRQEIAAKIRRYCSTDQAAYTLAIQTNACASLAGACARRFGDFGFTISELKQAIARADEILTGDLVWSFDSKEK